jgi:hypothetical protein
MGPVNPYKKKVSIVPLLRKILEIQLRIIEKAEPLIPPVLIFCFLYKVAKTLWRTLKMQKNIGWGMTCNLRLFFLVKFLTTDENHKKMLIVALLFFGFGEKYVWDSLEKKNKKKAPT